MTSWQYLREKIRAGVERVELTMAAIVLRAVGDSRFGGDSASLDDWWVVRLGWLWWPVLALGA